LSAHEVFYGLKLFVQAEPCIDRMRYCHMHQVRGSAVRAKVSCRRATMISPPDMVVEYRRFTICSERPAVYLRAAGARKRQHWRNLV